MTIASEERAAKKRAKQRMALVKAIEETPSSVFTARELRYLMEFVATKYAFASKRETGQMPGSESEIGHSIIVVAGATYRNGEINKAIPEMQI